jgi:hypothetical protein
MSSNTHPNNSEPSFEMQSSTPSTTLLTSIDAPNPPASDTTAPLNASVVKEKNEKELTNSMHSIPNGQKTVDPLEDEAACALAVFRAMSDSSLGRSIPTMLSSFNFLLFHAYNDFVNPLCPLSPAQHLLALIQLMSEITNVENLSWANSFLDHENYKRNIEDYCHEAVIKAVQSGKTFAKDPGLDEANNRKLNDCKMFVVFIKNAYGKFVLCIVLACHCRS